MTMKNNNSGKDFEQVRVAMFYTAKGYGPEYFEGMFIANNGVFDEQTAEEFCTFNKIKLFKQVFQNCFAQKVREPDQAKHDNDNPTDEIAKATIGETSGKASSTEMFTKQQGSRVPFLGESLNLRTNILLAALSKVGKTFFSIYLAGIALSRKGSKAACFFSFEDLNGYQEARFHESLKDFSIAVVTYRQWMERLDLEKSQAKNEAAFIASFYQKNPQVLQFANIQGAILNKKGISEKVHFKLLVFRKLMEEKIKEGYDFFVLDSLSSILGRTNTSAPELLEALLDLPGKYGVTFITIHHLTKDRKIYGPTINFRLYDTACILERAETNAFNENGTTMLKLSFSEYRYGNGTDVWIKRTRVSENIALHEVVDASGLDLPAASHMTIKEGIRNFLKSSKSDEVSFDDLFTGLVDGKLVSTDSRESVKNKLRQLAEVGEIGKVNGKWDRIKRLK